MKSYGLPYMGSKNKIAKYIVDVLPSGKRLVDLFCGGCAITDYAMKETNKYERFLINDLDKMPVEAYMKALNGGFKDEDRWLSREEYFKLVDKDPYVRFCFAFGSRGPTYMYNRGIEPYKEAIHHIVFWDDYSKMEALCPQVIGIIHEYCDGKDRKGKRLGIGNAITEHVKQKGSVDYWQSNPMFRAIKVKWTPDRRGLKGTDLLDDFNKCELDFPIVLQNLNCLERLQNLQVLENLERPSANITATNIDYHDYDHEEGDIVYCDPPYAGTAKYSTGFNSAAFWEWARTRDYPVYVSEYKAPDDFISVWHREKACRMNNATVKKTVEHLFIHKRWANEIQKNP